MVGIAMKILSYLQAASRNSVHHRSIPEHRQIEAVSVESDELRKQLANLFDKTAYQLCFGSLANVKNVFVVDPDIDIFSDEQVDWAFATRFQADRDLVVATGMRTLPLDPSLAGTTTGAKAGFDLTFKTPPSLEQRVPRPPTLDGRRFASLQAALADGPKFFAELMAAVGSRDGREIVRELEVLRGSGKLSRDHEGRYQVAS